MVIDKYEMSITIRFPLDVVLLPRRLVLLSYHVIIATSFTVSEIWANSSASPPAAISSTNASCSYDCTISGLNLNINWYRAAVTKVVAEETATINSSIGQSASNASLSLVNLTQWIVAPKPAAGHANDDQSLITHSDTFYEAFLSTTITSPTVVNIISIASIDETVSTIVNGKPTCERVEYDTASLGIFVVNPEGGNQITMPPSYLSNLGVMSPSECVHSESIVTANVPVSSLLTATVAYTLAFVPNTSPALPSITATESTQSPSTIIIPPSVPGIQPSPKTPVTIGLSPLGLPDWHDSSLASEPSHEMSITKTWLEVPPAESHKSPMVDPQILEVPSGWQSGGEPPWPHIIVIFSGNAVTLLSSVRPTGAETKRPQHAMEQGISSNPVMLTPGANDPANARVTDTAIPRTKSTAVLQSINIAGIEAIRNSNSQYIVGSQTLTPGAAAITIDGTPVSLDPSATALVIGSSTQPLIMSSKQSAFTADGFKFTSGSNSALIIGTKTVTPGAAAVTISGMPVSLAIDGKALMIGGSTIPVLNRSVISATMTPPAVIQVNGRSFTAVSGSIFILGPQTLIPGGSAITFGGTRVSLAPDGTAIVIGESAIPLPDRTTTPTVLQFNGQSFTAISGSELLIGSQTLIPGASAITVDGTRISLAPDGTAIVIGGSTVPIPLPTTTPVAVLELGGKSYTEISGSEFIIGSQTLVAGGSAITVNGTLVSLGVAATNLVVGTKTAALTTSGGLGEIIMGGFSGGDPGAPRATNTSDPAIFRGGANRVVEQRSGWLLLGMVFSGIVAELI